jgi:hypothetical protein
LNGALLNMLRQGGYILYARHGEATVGEDQRNLSFRDCNTQRNLSMYGRRQAVYYGEILRSLNIPISYPVISSPFCRAIETAKLAFGWENIAINPFWFDVYRLSGNLSTIEQNRILGTTLQPNLRPSPLRAAILLLLGIVSREGLVWDRFLIWEQ